MLEKKHFYFIDNTPILSAATLFSWKYDCENLCIYEKIASIRQKWRRKKKIQSGYQFCCQDQGLQLRGNTTFPTVKQIGTVSRERAAVLMFYSLHSKTLACIRHLSAKLIQTWFDDRYVNNTFWCYSKWPWPWFKSINCEEAKASASVISQNWLLIWMDFDLLFRLVGLMNLFTSSHLIVWQH